MATLSAGLLMCRVIEGELQFFLVHPGGPYFQNKESGVWSIPKGLPLNSTEILLHTALREFQEETGFTPSPPYESLGTIKQKGGKIVHAWSCMGEWNPANGIKSNMFDLEWPPRSGQYKSFPEQDKAAWMNLSRAATAIIPEQLSFLHRALILHNEKSV
jgi:predicted NUDIX family NTP pyrophosphohydrolase